MACCSLLAPADTVDGPLTRQAHTKPSRSPPTRLPLSTTHTNHRLGRRVVDGPVGAGLAGPRFPRGRQCTQGTSVPLVTSTPPCRPEPKRSPMSPPRYPGIPVPPPWPLSTSDVPAHAMCGLSLAGPGALLGELGDRPPPGPGRRRWSPGVYRNLTPPKQVRSSHTLALHQTSPTTNKQKQALHTSPRQIVAARTCRPFRSHSRSRRSSFPHPGDLIPSGRIILEQKRIHPSNSQSHSHLRHTKATGPVSKARPTNTSPASIRHRQLSTERRLQNPRPVGMRMWEGQLPASRCAA